MGHHGTIFTILYHFGNIHHLAAPMCLGHIFGLQDPGSGHGNLVALLWIFAFRLYHPNYNDNRIQSL